ncbi:hypothetical protein [Sulfuriroseicoccus oceanibius]|uniref:AsmA-like C-terminal domain-containing protein n=1 Tax=Sulfuriroseicoccus oceanibius TaxID=2707525 RepID=A0A6B3LAH2_9BACT|nr:hypothetical protein [Sulfuriroseicoccus oceanibius]QQL43952.1 hypothetical protein G3M56_008595 [Sulfuriroseicoccus oceanibius]
MPSSDQRPDPSASRSVPADEMMERLKSRGSSSSPGRSETVERKYDPETGEVRVKRRRRVKKKADPRAQARKRRQRLFWIFFAMVGLVTAVLTAGYYMVWGGVRTDAFRSGAEQVIATTLDQADVEAQHFQLEGTSLKSARLRTVGKPGAMIQRAELASAVLELDRDSFSGGDWLVKRISGSKLKLMVCPRGTAELPVDGKVGEGAQPGGFMLNRNPDAMDVKTYSFWDTDVVFGLDERRVKSSITDASVTMSRAGDEGFAGSVSSGRVVFDGWPVFDIDQINFVVAEDVVSVKAGALDVPSGSLTFIGDFPLSDGEIDASLIVQDVNLEQLVVGDWKPLFDGLMEDGEFDLTLDPGDPSSLEIRGDFKLSLLRLRQVRLLQTLATMLGGSDHDIGMFSGVSGSLVVRDEEIVIDQMQMETSQGVLLRGGVRVADGGVLSGIVRIGVPVERFGGDVPKLFKPGEDGMLWATVSLSGRRGSIGDDLIERIEKAERAGQSVEEGSNRPTADTLFEALTPEN